jgi:CheY-like chemotaxis protein
MDQIMDVSKIDAGRLTLELTKGDIIQFIKDIARSFEYLADLKKIEFECKADREGYNCSFDHDKLEKVLYNILSNAFKVTPQEGSIFVTMQLLDDAEERKLRIGISNTGAGISKEDLPHLFTRFYRTRSYAEGTGIGLSLTKSLVELQGGTIEVKSEETVGTTFYVTVPLREEAIPESEIDNGSALPRLLPIAESTESPELSSDVKASQDPDAKTILIVDDDRDMRSFISQLLEPFYTVVRAEDGQGALKLAYQLQPDLIISDMIMPVMDGYEFLRTLKADTNVSHIPIILLTAKGSVESRLQGLEEGADDYITKPFNEKILLARVKNLIEQRRLMKERFSTDIYLKPKEITITSLDEKFMQSLVDLVETNIADPNLNADVICQELGIGRSYLYAKVKAITDLSVNEFIKTLRLKHAAVLLINSEQNVNEVAISVGFNDRSHFSKSFAKQFGVSPAQYQRERLKS